LGHFIITLHTIGSIVTIIPFFVTRVFVTSIPVAVVMETQADVTPATSSQTMLQALFVLVQQLVLNLVCVLG
jgi:hypothetical protein